MKQIAETNENRRSKAPLGGSCRRRRLRGDTFKLLHYRGIPSPSKRFRRAFLPPLPQGEAWTAVCGRQGTRDGRKSCREGNLLLNIRVCGTGGRSSSDADGGSPCRPSWRADHVTPVKQSRFLPKEERSRQWCRFCNTRKPHCRRLPRGFGGWREQVDASSVTCCVVSPGDLLVSFQSLEKKLATQGETYLRKKDKKRLTIKDSESFFMEVPPRFELGSGAFAELCLTTWLWYQKRSGLNRSFKMERVTRLELATSTLARWRSTR